MRCAQVLYFARYLLVAWRDALRGGLPVDTGLPPLDDPHMMGRTQAFDSRASCYMLLLVYVLLVIPAFVYAVVHATILVWLSTGARLASCLSSLLKLAVAIVWGTSRYCCAALHRVVTWLCRAMR